MGKRVLQQRRGKASPTWRAPSHRYAGEISYPKERGFVRGTVRDILHSTGHSAPLALIRFDNGEESLVPAAEGTLVDQKVCCGPGAEHREGNILTLSEISDGTAICNIEIRPGDGGRIIRASGSYAYLTSKEGKMVNVRLPSGAVKRLSALCRATIGVSAGGGRIEKPLIKAGTKHYKMHARNLRWPRSSASARNPVDHPFGGGGHTHLGKSQTISHDAPPGRKVGSIAARRMGKGKK